MIKGEMLLLRPPYIYVKAGLVEADEYRLVKKAVYGLKESPLLWSKKEIEDWQRRPLKFQTRKIQN